MMTKEQFTDILLTLANRDAFGAASLGYLPQMLYAKWLLDNPEYAKDASIGIPGTYRKGARYSVPSPGELDIPFGEEMPAPFGKDEDAEGLFGYLSEKMAVMQYQNLWSKFEEVEAHITKVLMSLDLSERSIARTDIAAGFDTYLEEMVDAGGADIHLAPACSEQLIARIMKENWMENPSEIYDPFCRFGTLAETLPRTRNAPDTAITSVARIYREITHIRLGFRGIGNSLGTGSPVLSPKLADDGTLYRYGLVITDITMTSSEKSSSAFQLDIHKRYQPWYPDAEMLDQDTAMLTALGSMSETGHAAIITGNHQILRPDTLFSCFESAALKSYLVRDTLEAVIDIRVPARGLVRRRAGERGIEALRRIYIFSGEKPAERKNKVLFIDSASLTGDETMVKTIAECYRKFSEVKGVSAVVSLEQILLSSHPEFQPSAYTTVLEPPKTADPAGLLRDLKRLEDRRSALARDIAALAEKLTK